MIPQTETPLPLQSDQTLSLPPLPSQTNKVSFDAPQSWGTSDSVNTPPPLPPTTHLPEQESSPSIFKIILISLSLVLLGVLVGVLAAKFLQPTPTQAPMPKMSPVITPEISRIIESPSNLVESTPSSMMVSPQATPEGLLNTTWKNYSTDLYKLYYPTGWVFKYSSDKVTLTKLKNIITINKKVDPQKDVCTGLTIFSLNKGAYVWEVKEASPSTSYQVCEQQKNLSVPNTKLGSINLKLPKADENILNEFKYLLGKIELL